MDVANEQRYAYAPKPNRFILNRVRKEKSLNEHTNTTAGV